MSSLCDGGLRFLIVFEGFIIILVDFSGSTKTLKPREGDGTRPKLLRQSQTRGRESEMLTHRIFEQSLNSCEEQIIFHFYN